MTSRVAKLPYATKKEKASLEIGTEKTPYEKMICDDFFCGEKKIISAIQLELSKPQIIAEMVIFL